MFNSSNCYATTLYFSHRRECQYIYKGRLPNRFEVALKLLYIPMPHRKLTNDFIVLITLYIITNILKYITDLQTIHKRGIWSKYPNQNIFFHLMVLR